MPPKMIMLLDDDDDEADAFTVSASWVVDPRSGDMKHAATGTKISEEGGIEFEGQAYRLSAKDIQMDMASHLGAGACGIVKKGIIRKLNKEVALKTIKVDDKPKRDQLLHEIQGLVVSQGCPYLVQWYAGFVSKSNDSVYVALEYMDLGSLEDLVKRQKGSGVPSEYVGCIAKQSMEGLCFLHRKKLMHRDIKPGNILHSLKGEVKLTDFGIAKEVDMGLAQTFVGTTIYMSPERIRGDDYSLEADVWSLGMVVFELATGKYPWSDIGSFPAVFQHLCDDEEPRLDPSAFPEELCDYVARCLVKDADRRMDSLALTNHDLVMNACSRVEFSQWLQHRGFGTSLYPLLEEDGVLTDADYSAKMTQVRGGQKSASNGMHVASPTSVPAKRSAFGDDSVSPSSRSNLPLQLQRLPANRLEDVLAALRTLHQCGLSSVEDVAALEGLVSQKVAELAPNTQEKELQSMTIGELKQRAIEAGVPKSVLGDAEKTDLIQYLMDMKA